jgi:hypothetical protein
VVLQSVFVAVYQARRLFHYIFLSILDIDALRGLGSQALALEVVDGASDLFLLTSSISSSSQRSTSLARASSLNFVAM